jgi:N-acyl amino acid synthase FeeM
MDVQVSGHAPRFADRVAAMLERVEHRPAIHRGDREAAYRLRYEAYLRQNLLNERLDSMLYDEIYDESPNSLTTTTYIDGELASTVRVHVVNDKAAVSPALDVFPDVLVPRLKGRRIIIDPSRLAARADMARRFPELAYFALRPPWMAARHFNADYIVLSCARGHEEFYRRTCGCQTWSGPRSYPKVVAKVVCMGLEFAAEGSLVEARYPSFRSTPDEREALFGDFAFTLEPVTAPRGRVPAPADAQQADS